MGTIPVLSDAAIIAYIGEEEARKGAVYLRRDALVHVRRQGMTLKALCEGSQPEPYRARISFTGTTIDRASCSCPAGASGRCRHIAALLLFWRETPDACLVLDEVPVLLEQRDKADLIQLIQRMLERHPDLDELIDPPLPPLRRRKPVSAAVYRRQVAEIFASAGEGWRVEVRIAAQLMPLIQAADEFSERQECASAAIIYSVISAEVLANYYRYRDEGDLLRVIGRCIEGLDSCIFRSTEAGDEGTRLTALGALFAIYHFQLDSGVDVYDEADLGDLIANNASPTEKHMLASWVRDAIPEGDDELDRKRRQEYGRYLLRLQEKMLDDEGYLEICRETGLIYEAVVRLLSLNRVDEATALAQQVEPGDAHRVSELFARHGHSDVSERWMRERFRSPQNQNSRMLGILKGQYQARGDAEAALDLAETLFAKQPTMTGYREVRQLAGPLGNWETLGHKLRTQLKQQRRYGLLAQIYLDDGDIERAVDNARLLGSAIDYLPDIVMQVASAAEKTHPLGAFALYQQQVTALLNRPGRDMYRSIIDVLTKARALCQHLDDPTIWSRYIEALRAEDPQLRLLTTDLVALPT